MRMLVSFLMGASVLGLAFWAYQENYRTRQALAEMRQLQVEIGRLTEELDMLEAEWAYLNRPDRLRDLVHLNFGDLKLMPMTPEHFGRLDQVAYPPKPEPFPALPPQPASVPVLVSDMVREAVQ